MNGPAGLPGPQSSGSAPAQGRRAGRPGPGSVEVTAALLRVAGQPPPRFRRSHPSATAAVGTGEWDLTALPPDGASSQVTAAPAGTQCPGIPGPFSGTEQPPLARGKEIPPLVTAPVFVQTPVASERC